MTRKNRNSFQTMNSFEELSGALHNKFNEAAISGHKYDGKEAAYKMTHKNRSSLPKMDSFEGLSEALHNKFNEAATTSGQNIGGKEAAYAEMLGVVYDYFTNINYNCKSNGIESLNKEIFEVLNEYFQVLDDYYFQKEVHDYEKELFNAVENYFKELEQVQLQFAIEKLENGIVKAVGTYFDKKRSGNLINCDPLDLQKEVVEAVYGYFCEFKDAKMMNKIGTLKKEVKNTVRSYLMDRESKNYPRNKDHDVEEILRKTFYAEIDNCPEFLDDRQQQQPQQQEQQLLHKHQQQQQQQPKYEPVGSAHSVYTSSILPSPNDTVDPISALLEELQISV